LPFAYGLHYPADWFIQWSDYGQQIFSSDYRMDWKPVLSIPDEGALFFIMEYISDYDDPMEIMEKEQIPGLDAATEILDDPQAININGQPAASMVYRYYESGIGVSGPAVVERTIVTNGIHTIESMAITWEEQVEDFKPIFQNMILSLVLSEDRLEPAIGGSEIPADFEPYSSEKVGLSLATPPDWSVEETGDGIVLSPIDSSATSADFESFLVAASDPSANLYYINESNDLGSVIVDWYFAAIVGEFFPVSEYVSGSPSGQMAARAYYGGMSDDEPVLAIVNYTYQDGTLIRSVGMVPIGTDHRAIIENIMDSIVISKLDHKADASAEALEIGQLYEGAWSGGSPGTVTVDGVAGIPRLLMAELVGFEEDTLDSVTIYDPQGDTIVNSWVFSDERIPTLFEPDEDGIHLIEIGGGIPGLPPDIFSDKGQFTVELLDIDLSPNSDNLILNESGQLIAYEPVEYGMVATAGDSYLAVIRPMGLAAQTAFLSIEVTDENGRTVAENANLDLPGMELILPFQVDIDGDYDVLISAFSEQNIDYELYVIQDGRFFADTGTDEPTIVSYDLPSLDGNEIRIAVENAWPPFNFVDEETGEVAGYDYDLFTELCGRINCRSVFVETSWDQFTGLLDGSREFEGIDIGADGIIISELRAEHVDFSDPYIRLSQTLLIRADEDRFSNAEEFKVNPEWIVGTQLGTTNYDVAVDLVGEDRITVYDQFPIAVQALINGDVDAVVMDNVAGLGYVNSNPNSVKITGDVLQGEELGFIFAKGSELRDTINEVLAEMDKDGTMDELFQKWFIEFKPGT
jgi:polar amino acid transport system substrate-binding protein